MKILGQLIGMACIRKGNKAGKTGICIKTIDGRLLTKWNHSLKGV